MATLLYNNAQLGIANVQIRRPLDYSNPLTRKISVVARAGAEGWTQRPPFAVTPLGLAVAPQNGSVGHIGNRPCVCGVANSTIFAYWYFTAVPAWNSQTVIYRDTADAWPTDYGVGLNSPKSYGQVAMYLRDSIGNGKTVALDVFPGSIVAGTKLKMTATIDSALLVEGFGNEGQYMGNDTALQTFTFPTPALTSLPAMVNVNDTTNDPGTHVVMIVRWGRVLSRAEIKSMHQNPWQIFRSPRRIIFSSSTFQAAWARHSNIVLDGRA